jgi:hypothetical protein
MHSARSLHTRFLLFHPTTAYIVGFLTWMFVPPIFSKHGHNWEIIAIDLVGIFFFVVGAGYGAYLKRVVFGRATLQITRSSFDLLILVLAALIFALRIYHFMQDGIYAFLHQYATQSSILVTLKTTMTWPYITLLMTGAIVLKRNYCKVLIAVEVLLFIVPTMSRSYYFFAIFYGCLIYFFFFGVSRRFGAAAALWSAVILVLINIFGPYLHAVRSVTYVRDLDSISSVDFEEQKSENFLIERLNVHNTYERLAGYERKIAELDYAGFRSILPKLAGFTPDYTVNPLSVSTEAGLMIGYGSEKTATAFPKNWILYHLPAGIFAVIAYTFTLGLLATLTYHLIFSPSNLLFPCLWIQGILGVVFGGQGALLAAEAFQGIFVLFSLVTVALCFFALKGLRWLLLSAESDAA